MKSALVAGAVVFAFTAIATSACAQHDRGPPVDANGDGKITLAEFQASRVARTMRADTAHDGKISKAEFTAMVQKRMAHMGDGGEAPDIDAMFDRQDINGDGFITKDEIEHAASRRFDMLDTAHQGWITTGQLEEGRRGGGGGG